MRAATRLFCRIRTLAANPTIFDKRPGRRKPIAAMSERPAPESNTVPATGAWSGRFSEPMTERVKRYTASVDFDRRLAAADIAGSRAHARMLAAQGVIGQDDLAAIERGLDTIATDIDAGRFEWSRDLEDVHFNIERRLTALVGDAGKRLHTARSRNDQVATDVRLWLRGEIDRLADLLVALRRALIDLAEQHAATIMPGFTHLQVAQPVTFGHHLMAYDAMFARDRERLADCRRRVNRLPLGSAALAGTPFRSTASASPGSWASSTLPQFARRGLRSRLRDRVRRGGKPRHGPPVALREELVLWSTPRYGFVTLADRFCTGSSIMPQKKNPDVPELVRGKAGRVVGHLMALIVLMKAQPLAYNKDNQEDKEPLFDTVDTLADTLAIVADLVAGGISVHAGRMREAAREGFATATDLADHLVRRGVPFRDAHEAVARAVRHAEARGVGLEDLSLAELREFAPQAGDDVGTALTLEGSVASRAIRVARHRAGTCGDRRGAREPSAAAATRQP